MKMKTRSQPYAGIFQAGNSSNRKVQSGLETGRQAVVDRWKALAVLLPEIFDNENHSESAGFRLVPGSQPLVRATRLVVLIPDIDFDSFELVRRVWRLALPGRLSIVFMALARNEQTAAVYHQRLTNLAFLIADPRLRVNKFVLTGSTWPAALRQVLQPGDLPVCLDGLPGRKSIFHKQSLDALAASQSTSAVLVLQGIPVESTTGKRQAWTGVLAWLCSVLTMAGFGFVQVRLTLQASGWTLNVFLILSMIIEFILIFKINNWIN